MNAYEVISLILAVVFGLAGIVGAYFAILAFRSARESAQIAREGVELAREQASMRPDLRVSLAFTRRQNSTHRGRLHVEVYNSGRTGARNVHGWIHLPANMLGPSRPRSTPSTPTRPGLDYSMLHVPQPTISVPPGSSGEIFDDKQEAKNGWYEAQIYENDEILPTVVKSFEIPVEVSSQGGTATIKWSVTCSEVPVKRGQEEIEIPPFAEGADQG